MRPSTPAIREKPHRLPRDAYRGRIRVALTACVAARRPLFTAPHVVEPFVQTLRRAATQHLCSVAIYCFMPDHLHLVLQGEEPRADAWGAMVEFKQHSGFWLSQQHPGVRWQKDFYDHVIRADEDLRSHLRYIANNPVRQRLVDDWASYPFTGSIGFDLRSVLEYADGSALERVRLHGRVCRRAAREGSAWSVGAPLLGCATLCAARLQHRLSVA